jgi:hypothetical protein
MPDRVPYIGGQHLHLNNLAPGSGARNVCQQPFMEITLTVVTVNGF